jgi:transcriptional regulator with XRE-family HTH domain
MNNIRTLRAEQNLSQSELAKQVHVHQTAVSQWESGKTNPDMQQAIVLANFFNVSVDYILGRNAERNSSFVANNIHDSQFVQGSGHLVVNGENNKRTLLPEESELLRIYGKLSVKSRMKLLECAFELEQGDNEQ